MLFASAALVAAGVALETVSPALAEENSSATAVPVDARSPLAALNFPLLVALRADPAWASALRNDRPLVDLARERAQRVTGAADCMPLPGCRVTPWLWTEADIALVGARLAHLAQTDDRLLLVENVLRPSRRFALHEGLDDTGLLKAAWTDAARSMNAIMQVYAGGDAPRYPDIDPAIFDTARPDYGTLLTALDTVTLAQGRSDDLFFEGPVRQATTLLIVNERTDATKHRPVLGGDNAVTLARLERDAREQFPYTALLVFGHGPDDALSSTGPLGHLRLRLAADRLSRGLAPVIIVSGGAVHPARTRFNEAAEMRRELIEQYGVPADRILMEPHARHTTTNLRNVARLMLSAGMSAERDALILSTPETIEYIGGEELMRRNISELGYQPGVIAPGPDTLSLTFRPLPISFHVDAMDPLDP